MAEEIKRYVNFDDAKYLWDAASRKYVAKDGNKVLSDNNYSTEEKTKLAELENYELPNASGETLGGIKIGAGLHINEDGVVSTSYNPEMGVDWDMIQDKPTTVEAYGITDAATKDDLAAVEEKVSKVYKYKGKVATVADLAGIVDPDNGDVYDVEENGKNYAWNADENRWDDLGGVFEIESLTQHDLDMITGSTDSEEMFDDLIEAGRNIELGANLTLSKPVVIDKDIIIDLNGHTISSIQDGYMFTADGANLTLKNGIVSSNKRIASAVNGGQVVVESGTYSSGDVAFSATGADSKVTIDGGTIAAQEGGVGAFDGGEIEVNGGHIEGIDNFPLFTNGAADRGGNIIVMNGGELVGNIQSPDYEACGVYIANNDSFTMNGGAITANGGCGILMRAGTVVINDGVITATTGEHVPGWVGDLKGEAGKMSASAIIYHESANYPGKAGMSLTINGGVFTGADHALEVLSNEETPNVMVNGGEFNPAYPEV